MTLGLWEAIASLISTKHMDILLSLSQNSVGGSILYTWSHWDEPESGFSEHFFDAHRIHYHFLLQTRMQIPKLKQKQTNGWMDG